MKAHDINSVLKSLPLLKGRTPATSEEEAAPSFATLATMGGGGVFVGSFQGESPWERHPAGDELVQVVAGFTRLTVLTDEGTQILELSAGSVTVVPQGCWHRFEAPESVSVLTATPLPTEHSQEETPPAG